MMKSDLWTGEKVLSVLSFMSGIVPEEEKTTQTNADSLKVSAEPDFTTCYKGFANRTICTILSTSCSQHVQKHRLGRRFH